VIERVAFELAHASVEAWWAAQLDLSSSMAETIGGLDSAERDDLRAAVAAAVAPFTLRDGDARLPRRDVGRLGHRLRLRHVLRRRR
jgi:hypothetical protein